MSVERCPKCGTPYQDNASFCINCGMNKAQPAKEVDDKPDKSGFAPPASERAAGGAGAETGGAGAETTEPAPAAEPTPEPSPAAEPSLAPEPAPPAETAPAPEESSEAVTRLEAETKPGDELEFKPRKKGFGCCLGIVILAIIAFIFIAVGIAVLLLFGVIGGGGAKIGEGDTYDFEPMRESDFDVWDKGEDASYVNEKGMLKVHNALVGLRKDYGSDYAVEVTVFFVSVGDNDGWAGPVLRVNPGGGDRYAFKLMPEADKVAIEKGGEVVAEKAISLETGIPYLVYAETDGNDLGLALNDKPMLKATDIGLIAGGIGLEARGCTAYFDDLTVKVLE